MAKSIVILPDWDDERVYGEVWGMAAAQDKSNRHETVEEAENHLQESELLKLEES